MNEEIKITIVDPKAKRTKKYFINGVSASNEDMQRLAIELKLKRNQIASLNIIRNIAVNINTRF